jgi:hypothetical protein
MDAIVTACHRDSCVEDKEEKALLRVCELIATASFATDTCYAAQAQTFLGAANLLCWPRMSQHCWHAGQLERVAVRWFGCCNIYRMVVYALLQLQMLSSIVLLLLLLLLPLPSL